MTRWISIDDAVRPEEDAYCLVWNGYCITGALWKNGSFESTMTGKVLTDVLYWLFIPAPPQMEKHNETLHT